MGCRICTFNVEGRKFVHLGKEGELFFSKDMELSLYATNKMVLSLNIKARGVYLCREPRAYE